MADARLRMRIDDRARLSNAESLLKEARDLIAEIDLRGYRGDDEIVNGLKAVRSTLTLIRRTVVSIRTLRWRR